MKPTRVNNSLLPSNVKPVVRLRERSETAKSHSNAMKFLSNNGFDISLDIQGKIIAENKKSRIRISPIACAMMKLEGDERTRTVLDLISFGCTVSKGVARHMVNNCVDRGDIKLAAVFSKMT